jgi:hypothetical protein
MRVIEQQRLNYFAMWILLCSWGSIKWNVLFSSIKQPNTTLSSTEAEHSAAVEATKELIWFSWDILSRTQLLFGE